MFPKKQVCLNTSMAGWVFGSGGDRVVVKKNRKPVSKKNT